MNYALGIFLEGSYENCLNFGVCFSAKQDVPWRIQFLSVLYADDDCLDSRDHVKSHQHIVSSEVYWYFFFKPKEWSNIKHAKILNPLTNMLPIAFIDNHDFWSNSRIK